MSDVTALPTDDDPGAWIGWTTIQQAIASDPLRSAWVSANAGSGKTHVLTQRVIRLLLAGARPSAILCLTYTKAAASEMSTGSSSGWRIGWCSMMTTLAGGSCRSRVRLLMD